MTLRDRLAHGSLWVLLSQLVVQAMSVLVTVILARYLGATAQESASLLGKYFIFTTVGTVLAQVAVLGLNAALPKLLAEYRVTRPALLERLVGSALSMTLLSAAVVAVVYLVLGDWVAGHIYRDEALTVLLWISAPVVVFTALGLSSLSILQGFQRIREYSLAAMAFSILSVPLTWLLVIHHAAVGLPTALIGAAAASLLTIALQAAGVIYLAKRSSRAEGVRLGLRPDRPRVRALLGLSMPVFAGTVLLRPAILYQASVIFLVLGDTATGVWKITSAFYRVLLFLPLALAIPMLPAMSEMYATEPPRERRAKVTQILRMTIVVALPASLVAGLGAQYLIDFLFGQTYLTNGSVQATFLLSAAAFFESLALVIISLLQGTGRTKQAFGLDALQAVLIVSLTLTLITPGLGLVGAALATLVNACATLVFAVVYVGRRGEVDLRSLGEMLGFSVFAFGGAALVLVWFLGKPYYAPLAAGTILALFGIGFRLLRQEDRVHLRHLLQFLRPRNGQPLFSPKTPAEPGRR